MARKATVTPKQAKKLLEPAAGKANRPFSSKMAAKLAEDMGAERQQKIKQLKEQTQQVQDANQPRTVPQQQHSPAEGTGGDYIQWKWRSTCGQYGILRISTGGTAIDYVMERHSPFCYRLRYADGPGSWTEYSVQLGTGQRCGCASYRTNSRGELGATCKHIRALMALREQKAI